MNRICRIQSRAETLAYLVQSDEGLYHVNRRAITYLPPEVHSRPRRQGGELLAWSVSNTDPDYFLMLQSESGQTRFERQADVPGHPAVVASDLQRKLRALEAEQPAAAAPRGSLQLEP